uniref:AP endonuclease n=1 Tax=uncultured Bacillota bacterium TaxID=344338 RepID=A0A650F4U9_9FIRM|nr:AP endonuclease [uncultured Firmicutes bacterium]
MISFGFRGHDFPDNEIGALARRCHELEVTHLQLALRKSFPDLIRDGVFSPGLARHLKIELDRCGVAVSVLGCYINPIHPDEQERQREVSRFCEMLWFAKYMGADMVGTETGSLGKTPADNRTEAVYQTFTESMRQIVSCAEKLGVMVGVEGVTQHTLYSPKMVKKFLDEIGSPNVSVIFDAVNLIDTENAARQEEMMDEAFELFGDRISVIHLKDYTVRDGVKQRAEVGEGDFNFRHLFAWCKKNKPYIHAVVEEIPPEQVQQTRRFLQECYDNA